MLGAADIAALTINATVGAGILGLPGKLFALLGAWSLLACVASGVIVAVVGWAFASAGGRFATSGGAALYARTAFGGGLGLTVGLCQILSGLFNYATVANILVSHAGLPRLPLLLVLGLVLGGIVYSGVGLSAVAVRALTIVKFSVLLGFVALAIPAIPYYRPPPTPFPAASRWLGALAVMMFALGGLEGAVVGGGEIRRPSRDVPLGLAAAIGIIVALYAAVVLASMASVPNLANSVRPVLEGARHLGGSAAGEAVLIGGAVAITGVLFGLQFSGPRVLFALAEAGQMPAILARVHPRRRTPAAATIAYATAATTIAITFTTFGALPIAAVFRGCIYLAVIAAALRLAASPRPEQIP